MYLLTSLTGQPTTLRTEFRGAVATFLTMAYILPVNATILSSAVGVEHVPALIAATALAAFVCCTLMGLVANVPIALASGMGLNALVAFTIVRQAGSYQAAMGLVVLEGLLILGLVLLGLREAVLAAIPRDLRIAIAAGIGLFIALIGLSNAGISMQGVPAPPAGPLLQAGRFATPATALALGGLLLTAVFLTYRLKGALILGIVATTVLALVTGQVGLPSKVFTVPALSELGAIGFKPDLSVIFNVALYPLLFSILMIDFFDTLGTATAIAEEAHLVDGQGRPLNARRLLIVDSLSASIGGLFGVSSNTSYIESAAGVAEGARTGLHTVFVGLLFLGAMFFSPLLSMIPPYATAPTLILVGFFMLKPITTLNFEDPTLSIPSFLTLLTIPTTFSIAHGIGLGLVSHTLLVLVTKGPKAVPWLLYPITAAFLAYFIFAPH